MLNLILDSGFLRNKWRVVFSRDPRLYKRVCPSVGRSVGNLFSAGRNEDGEQLISCNRICSFYRGVSYGDSTSPLLFVLVCIIYFLLKSA